MLNLFLSSSFDSDIFNNSKTSFRNNILTKTLDYNGIQLVNINLDSKIIYNTNFSNCIIIKSQFPFNDHHTHNSLYTLKTIKIDDGFLIVFSFSHVDCSNKYDVYNILKIAFESSTKNMVVLKQSIDGDAINVEFLGVHSIWFNEHFFTTLFSSDSSTLIKERLTIDGMDLGYYTFRSDFQLLIKQVKTPNFIKIYCKETALNQYLTSNCYNLLAILPYKQVLNFNYEVAVPFSISLYDNSIESLTFLITNENGEQLATSTGYPTLIQTRLINELNMNNICYFNSNDAKSKKFFPNNCQSYFTQKLSQVIDARYEKHYASLHTIFIPSDFNNIDNFHTNFSISNKSGQIKQYSLPSYFYTPESFIEKLSETLQDENIVIQISRNNKLIFINNNAYDVNFSINAQLAFSLGVSSNVNENFVYFTLKGENSAEMLFTYKFFSLSTRLIKIKCDILTNSLVGTNYQKIFKILNIDPKQKNETGYFFQFISEEFIQILPQIYNEVKFSLYDENDRLLTFNTTTAVQGVFLIRKY